MVFAKSGIMVHTFSIFEYVCQCKALIQGLIIYLLWILKRPNLVCELNCLNSFIMKNISNFINKNISNFVNAVQTEHCVINSFNSWHFITRFHLIFRWQSIAFIWWGNQCSHITTILYLMAPTLARNKSHIYKYKCQHHQWSLNLHEHQTKLSKLYVFRLPLTFTSHQNHRSSANIYSIQFTNSSIKTNNSPLKFSDLENGTASIFLSHPHLIRRPIGTQQNYCSLAFFLVCTATEMFNV